MNTVRATDYRDIVQVGDPRISPDGERVAFVRKLPKDDESYEATVYVVPVGGDEPRQFTVSEGVDSQPRWSPSGDRLAFVSTRGADDDRPQLWVMPTGGGEARQVTDVAGGVAAIAWSPDGSRIAFTQSSTETEREEGLDITLGDEEYEPEPPDPRVIDRKVYRAGRNYLDGRRSHLYVVDLDAAANGDSREGEDGDSETDDGPVERLTDGDYDHSNPEWGDADTLYYGVKRTGDPDDNIVVDILAHDFATGEAEDVTQTTGWSTALAATSDGRVAYAYTPEENATLRQTEIEVLDRETGEVTRPTETLDRTLALSVVPQWGLLAPQWGPKEEDLFFITPDEGTETLWRVPGDASADPTAVVDEGGIYGASVGENAVAFVRSEWDHPGDVFVSTLRGAESNRLTRVNSEYLDDHAVCQPEEFWFENDGGDEIQGWVLTPPDFEGAEPRSAEGRAVEPRDTDEQYPLAVEIHGGPHSMWTTSGTMWHEFQMLAARGYVVFWSNPRGSTGYGEEFVAALGEGRWGTVAAEDVLAGVEEVAARDYVDEDDAFVTGGSYGGYLTAWLVGHTDRFEAAVAQRGVYDLNSFFGSTDAFKLVEWDFDATPLSDPELLWEQSPTAHASEVETPTLLVHSDEDYRVPVNNAEMLYLLYKKNGVETRLVRYPREGHELSRSGEPAHVVDRLERIVRWFDGYSAHHDVPKALDRGDDGLSGAAADDQERESDDNANGDEADDGSGE